MKKSLLILSLLLLLPASSALAQFPSGEAGPNVPTIEVVEDITIDDVWEALIPEIIIERRSPYALGMISPAVAGGGVAGDNLSCSRTTQQAPTDAVTYGSSQYEFGTNSGNSEYATKFVYGGTTGSLCSVDIYFRALGGSPSGDIDVYLYSHNSGDDEPDSSLGLIGSTDASTIGANSWATFEDGAGASIVNSNTYWIVVKTATDASNYNNLGLDSSAATMRVMRQESSWIVAADGTYTLMFRLYILE